MGQEERLGSACKDCQLISYLCDVSIYIHTHTYVYGRRAHCLVGRLYRAFCFDPLLFCSGINCVLYTSLLGRIGDIRGSGGPSRKTRTKTITNGDYRVCLCVCVCLCLCRRGEAASSSVTAAVRISVVDLWSSAGDAETLNKAK